MGNNNTVKVYSLRIRRSGDEDEVFVFNTEAEAKAAAEEFFRNSDDDLITAMESKLVDVFYGETYLNWVEEEHLGYWDIVPHEMELPENSVEDLYISYLTTACLNSMGFTSETSHSLKESGLLKIINNRKYRCYNIEKAIARAEEDLMYAIQEEVTDLLLELAKS